jgi:hypothetical protein
MKNATHFNSAYTDTASLVDDILEQEEPAQTTGLVNWWFRFTGPPELPARASFVKREVVRRARLLSAVVFFLILSLVIMLPAAFFLPTILVLFVILGILAASVIALFFNRAGYTLVAGLMVVSAFELGLIAGMWVLSPLDVIHLPSFDLFIMGELLAISLLPARSIFLVAAFNVLFMWLNIRFQPLTPIFKQYLDTQLLVAMLRPTALQIIVAGVAYLWARSTTNAIARADRAEMIAALEHTLAEQKNNLEQGIQQILHTHALVAKGDLGARAPLNKDNLLWQVANSLNNFLGRYQRAYQSEQKLHYLVGAITSLSNTAQEAAHRQRFVQFHMTRTELDALVISLNSMNLSLSQAATSAPPSTPRHHQNSSNQAL